MIKLLHIENIAVIEKADIEFTQGLNVLTGETGAGKSIVIDALTAVTGGRTSRDIIRTGAEAASVTAVFECDLSDWFEDNGIEPDESGEIFITRKISADGKSTCRVNGAPVPAARLRELGARLIDIHGQNDGRKLLDEGAHLTYLDSFGGLDGALTDFKTAFKKLKAKKAEIASLTLDEDEKERRIDALKYQIDEIERAKIKPGEFETLSSRRDMLVNSSKLTESVDAAFESLYGGESTDGAVALINDAQGQIDRAARYFDDLRALGERLLDIGYTVQDISDELRDIRAKLDFSPGELDELESRLDTLRRVTRKYGGENEALEHLERSRAELSDIEDSTGRLLKLEGDLDACTQESRRLAGHLSDLRKTAAAELEERVMTELSQLNMPGVKFKAEFTDARGELNETGCDEVRFLMSANAGQEPGRISRIASGGELSRIMLALKNVLSGEQDTGTMVFDEVDSGVSGIAAQRVGEKLQKLAQRRQVLCVTHLAQIAAMADTQFEIQKSVSGGKTFTHVTMLDTEGRKREIARLIGGENITPATLTSAEEQLGAAREYRERIADGRGTDG